MPDALSPDVRKGDPKPKGPEGEDPTGECRRWVRVRVDVPGGRGGGGTFRV